MLQAPMFDGLFFDPFALVDNSRRPTEVGIGRRDVAERFVIALMVVMLDKRKRVVEAALRGVALTG